MLTEKRSAMFEAAKFYAEAPGSETERALCMAAAAYAEARLSAASGGTAAARMQESKSGAVIPFGRNKGKPLSAVPLSDLEWTLGAVEKSIADPDKARFLEANEALRDALRAEISRR